LPDFASSSTIYGFVFPKLQRNIKFLRQFSASEKGHERNWNDKIIFLILQRYLRSPKRSYASSLGIFLFFLLNFSFIKFSSKWRLSKRHVKMKTQWQCLYFLGTHFGCRFSWGNLCNFFLQIFTTKILKSLWHMNWF
jgi:hypothetical protein